MNEKPELVVTTNATTAAEGTLQQAWGELNFVVEAGLFAAAGDYTDANAELQSLLENKRQFYGKMQQSPSFDAMQAAGTNKEFTNQYQTMQENCKDIKLTKFGV